MYKKRKQNKKILIAICIYDCSQSENDSENV